MNLYFYLAIVNLFPEIRKLSLELGFVNNWNLAKLGLILFLNFDNFARKSI